jgi:hypothetical protein
MKISKVRFSLCLAISFAVLITPFLLGISLDGKAHAMGFLGSSGGNSSGTGVNVSESAPNVYPNPEPATLLLFGAGAVGLAVIRKKFRKK